MKILFLSHKFYPFIGGTETNSEIFAAGFVSKGAQVRLLTWTQEDGDRNFPYEIVRNPSFSQILDGLKWADVVFENSPVLRMSWVNIFVRKPVVTVLNTWLSASAKINFQAFIKRAWLKQCKYVVAVSKAVKQKCFPNAVIIENAYDDSLFVEKNIIRNKKSFVFLGRLVSDKGADQAIEAFARLKNILKEDFSSLSLAIVGDGPEMDALQRLVSGYGLQQQVVFKGVLRGDELVNELNTHQYLLVPSVWEEPFGLVALEGMACGCIPVVSDGGGLPDAVGNAGITFKRNDLNDFVLKLSGLFQDESLKEELKRNAKQHLADHSRQVVVDKYFELLEQAVR